MTSIVRLSIVSRLLNIFITALQKNPTRSLSQINHVHTRNEIEAYINAQYISASEVLLSVYKFALLHNKPPLVKLSV